MSPWAIPWRIVLATTSARTGALAPGAQLFLADGGQHAVGLGLRQPATPLFPHPGGPAPPTTAARRSPASPTTSRGRRRVARAPAATAAAPHGELEIPLRRGVAGPQQQGLPAGPVGVGKVGLPVRAVGVGRAQREDPEVVEGAESDVGVE